ncbi:helix-turn-helix domain-containing protein [Gemmobacter fulva]|uniref:helix-turn-helix domain-containing protein n=1 Tax=Gemmobacter fulvus TaxID=2840474 RepID=UPI001C007E2F|nr:XRE family transcriptional regulator [Gemmobacter fulvus]
MTIEHSKSRPRDEDAHAGLAERIRTLRQAQGMSQVDLAAKAGFARSTLSKIEKGQLSPTFELLLKLARGLQIELAALVQPERHPLVGRLHVERRMSGVALDYPNHRFYALASQLQGRHFQAAVVDFIEADLAAFGPMNRHESEDMLFVLSGRLAFHSEGYTPITLDVGDSLFFDGTMGHACLSASQTEPCQCLYVYAAL